MTVGLSQPTRLDVAPGLPVQQQTEHVCFLVQGSSTGSNGSFGGSLGSAYSDLCILSMKHLSNQLLRLEMEGILQILIAMD